MGIIVQKYGGTSVADAEKIKGVAKRILATHEKGNQVVVVLSAMGKTTDSLLELVDQLSANPSSREIDMLLATGEQISIAMMAIAIHALGHDAISFTGPQVGIMTDTAHRKAKITSIEPERIKEALENVKLLKGLLPICAWCKKIRDDKGYWQQVETYISKYSDADFTHSICPSCQKKMTDSFEENV